MRGAESYPRITGLCSLQRAYRHYLASRARSTRRCVPYFLALSLTYLFLAGMIHHAYSTPHAHSLISFTLLNFRAIQAKLSRSWRSLLPLFMSSRKSLSTLELGNISIFPNFTAYLITQHQSNCLAQQCYDRYKFSFPSILRPTRHTRNPREPRR